MSSPMSEMVSSMTRPQFPETTLPKNIDAERHRRIRARRFSSGRGGMTIAVNFAPMIDVTFLLLIFFLVTTTFERAEGILAAHMPQDSGASAVALPLSPIVVHLTQTGIGPDDFVIRIAHFDNRPENFTELTETLRRLQQEPGFDAETPVVIIGEDEVRWDHVVNCWNAALRAGCTKIAFGEP